MKIIEKLVCHDEWLRFKEYKLSGGHLTARQEKELNDFIDKREYLTAAQNLNSGGFFGIPQIVLVNKTNSDKKRTVFSFSRDENYIQKFIAFLLLDYDYLFAGNLYSFRKDMGVKKAIDCLMHHKGINEMYSYKLDISDYFNSVDPGRVLPLLRSSLTDDGKLYDVIRNMLTCPFAMLDGERVSVKKGILAGSPVSGFLANLYLTQLDEYFESRGVLYARYSDDIIFFAQSETELEEYIKYVEDFLTSKGLCVNPQKICRTAPHEEWTFLGFSYKDSVIDISDISKQKLKKKMRRKARALVRWKNKKGASGERAAKAFIRHFNKKFYSNAAVNEITWSRWYFPVITTCGGLKEIDAYMQQCIRYIVTGRRSKSQYNFRYSDMKKLGYCTLVNKYYEFKNEIKNK